MPEATGSPPASRRVSLPRAQPAPGRSPHVGRAIGLRIALVNMPFASSRRPSIQLGLLSALARSTGADCDTFYFNLDLAARLTPERYEQMCEHRGHMTGDWLFSVAAFGLRPAVDTSRYFAAFPQEAAWVEHIGADLPFIQDLRERALPDYVESCAESVDWSRYDIVGFTSTFQQNVASLALARAIKRRAPSVLVLFGGANVEGEMGLELLRSFPWVDLAVSGEADEAFPALLAAKASSSSFDDVPGVLQRRADGSVAGRQAPAVTDLDVLPIPDYGEYFRRAESLDLLATVGPALVLPFETSRGCWWGAKHHCTFCGLNGSGMGYRKKSPERVTAELDRLSAQHAVTSFEAVDNILSMDYLDTVFRGIEEQRLDYTFFYEVKSNLTHDKIRQLARAGVRRVQPGIESLSTNILRLMRKGCTMLQNVLCLKWCRYYDIGVSWNILAGFPGETADDYRDQLSVLEAITHLEPPTSCGRIWMERFSPYFTGGERLGIHQLRPSRSYSFVYPEHVDLQRLAYFFDYEAPDALPDSAHAPTRAFVEEWNAVYASDDRHRLSYRRTPNMLFVDHYRGPGRSGTYALSGEIAAMYEHCGDAIRTPSGVRAHLAERFGSTHSVEDVRETLQGFCDARLMLGEDDRFLALAIPTNSNL